MALTQCVCGCVGCSSPSGWAGAAWSRGCRWAWRYKRALPPNHRLADRPCSQAACQGCCSSCKHAARGGIAFCSSPYAAALCFIILHEHRMKMHGMYSAVCVLPVVCHAGSSTPMAADLLQAHGLHCCRIIWRLPDVLARPPCHASQSLLFSRHFFCKADYVECCYSMVLPCTAGAAAAAAGDTARVAPLQFVL